jgi:cobalt/nickel transport system permease protein
MLRKIPRFFIYYYGLAGLWLGTTAMHIPDGYLSPLSSLIMFFAVLPFWMRGVQKLREKINAKNIPIVALLAAFSFVIMLFNIPLPGGTSGHAVGAALAAIILGPEIAVLSVSTALVIQALLFGDGGILAIGANCFNMAVVLPYVSYAVYQAFSKNQPLQSKRRLFAAALGGWSGLTAASFFAAVEFGIQPLLWHTPEGVPLYAPYPLSVAIPAMVFPHALVASVVEGLVTALVLAYLQRANQPVLNRVNQPVLPIGAGGFSRWRSLWGLLAVLIVAAPIGLLAPGTAWGEWSTAELSGLGLSFIPKGMQQLTGLWSAPLASYNLPFLGNASLAYILSAIVGILVIVLVVWLFSSLAGRNSKSTPETASDN